MGSWRGLAESYPPNPYPDTVATGMWRFWCELKRREPGSKLGGFYAKKSGYHGKPADLEDHGVGNRATDYSIRYARDRGGPNLSAAIDWTFPDAQAGDYRRFAMYGARVKTAFLNRDPRLVGWREWLGQTDVDSSLTGEGLDFYTWETRTPDASHRWHAHKSKTRTRLHVWNDYLNMLSILDGETLAQWRERTTITEGVEPMLDDADKKFINEALLRTAAIVRGQDANRDYAADVNAPWINSSPNLGTLRAQMLAGFAALGAAVEGVDEAVLARLGGVPVEMAAETLIAALGEQTAGAIAAAVTARTAAP